MQPPLHACAHHMWGDKIWASAFFSWQPSHSEGLPGNGLCNMQSWSPPVPSSLFCWRNVYTLCTLGLRHLTGGVRLVSSFQQEVSVRCQPCKPSATCRKLCIPPLALRCFCHIRVIRVSAVDFHSHSHKDKETKTRLWSPIRFTRLYTCQRKEAKFHW